MTARVRASIDAILMKSSVLLSVVFLVSLLSGTGPALSGRSSEREAYPYLFDQYWYQPSRGPPYAADGDWAFGSGGGDGMREPRDAREPVQDPFRTGPHQAPWTEPYGDQVPGGGYGGYSPPYGQAPYLVDQVRRQDAAAAWGDRYPDESGMRWGPPSAVAHGYHFRGDDPAGFGGWGAAPHRNGYRFRPLTEQERQRAGSGTEWRPREPASARERPRRADPLPVRDAHGYWSENWFNRY